MIKVMFKNEKGYALVLVLIIMLIFFMLGTVLITVSTTQVREAVRQEERVQAYYLAYSGANAVAEWIMNGGDVPEGESEVVELDTGSFFVVVVESGNQLTITSRSTVDGYPETVRVILSEITTENGQGAHPAFDYALFSKSPLTTSSGINVDGSIYGQSVVLPSAQATVSNDIISETFVRIHGNNLHPYIGGNVCALAGDAEIAFSGGLATVAGDVNASGNVSIGSSGTVNGNVYSGVNVTLLSANARVASNIHAANDVLLQSGTVVSRNVFSGGNVSLLNSNSRIVENVHAAQNINMQGSTYIDGNSWAGGSTNQHNQEFINQSVPPRMEPMAPTFCIETLIDVPDLTNITSNTNHISVPQSSSNYILEPGIYGDLFVGGASTIIFKTGNYIFNSIDGNRWGQIIRLDLSNGGPINIYSKNDIIYSPLIQVSEDGDTWVYINDLTNEDAVRLGGKVYWETHENFTITTPRSSPHWFGTVLANGNINIQQSNTTLIGAFSVRNGSITMNSNQKIIYAPPTNSAAGGSANGENGNNGGNQTETRWGNPLWSDGDDDG